VLAVVEDGDDVRMVQLARGLRLEHEALLVLGAAGRVFLEDDGLQREQAVEVRILGLVDDAHRAAAELADDAVAPDLLLRRGHQLLTRRTSARTYGYLSITAVANGLPLCAGMPEAKPP